jgi:hypothetical protein
MSKICKKLFRIFHKIFGVAEVQLSKGSVNIVKKTGKNEVCIQTKPKPKVNMDSDHPSASEVLD